MNNTIIKDNKVDIKEIDIKAIATLIIIVMKIIRINQGLITRIAGTVRTLKVNIALLLSISQI